MVASRAVRRRAQTTTAAWLVFALFFLPGLALAAGSAAAGFDMYGVGESTMVGEPFDERLSLPALISKNLGGQFGGQSIAVHLVAQRGAGSHAQAERFARTLAGRDAARPGVALIYAGHNEPFLDDAEQAASGGLAPDEQARMLLRRNGMLRDALSDLRARLAPKPRASIQLYEQSLRRMIEVARAAGLTPVLFTLPSNISSIEPNAYAAPGTASAPTSAHDPRGATSIEALLAHAAELERQQGAAAALAYCREQAHNPALPLSSKSLLLYCAAREERTLGLAEQARKDFWAVVDQDLRLNFGRATTAQNDLIRRLASEYRIPLVDALAAFEQASPKGILGDELLSDGHHPNLRGYATMAELAGRRLVQLEQELEATSGAPAALPDRKPLTAEQIPSAFQIGTGELGRAHIGSGAWLLATAAYHPWPVGRLTWAEQHFRAALGGEDDFSAWLGIAVAQASLRGGFLRTKENVDWLGQFRVYYSKSFEIPASERDELLARLRAAQADDAVLQRVRELWRG